MTNCRIKLSALPIEVAKLFWRKRLEIENSHKEEKIGGKSRRKKDKGNKQTRDYFF